MLSPTTILSVTFLTLLLFTGIGIYFTRGAVQSFEDYIVAPGTAGTGSTTATLIASSMGAWILFSPAEAGAIFGGITAVLGYALGSALAMLGYVAVAPRVRRLIPEGHSLTEFALVRYGRGMHLFTAVVSILYMFIFLAAELTGITKALGLMGNVQNWQIAGLIGFFVLIYTFYGGLKASIFTDSVQTLVLLPLLVLGFIGTLYVLDGGGRVYGEILETHPELLQVGFWPGVKFGIYVIIAVIAAEMMNQSWWQRIYAARSQRTLRTSFLLSALIVFPVILIAGVYGIIAVSKGWVSTSAADTAFFQVMFHIFPDWFSVIVVLLVVLLVMSTADTLFNAISSLIAGDLSRFYELNESTLTTIARGITIVVAIGATLIGAQGYSVLEVFLTADLLAAATFVPLLSGLFLRSVDQRGALLASFSGLCGGMMVFPVFRSVLAEGNQLEAWLPAPSFLRAFLGALVLSSLVTVCSNLISTTQFDVRVLKEEIQRYDS